MTDAARMRFLCRRGMLELDRLLRHFFDTCFITLLKDERQAFAKLLECEDPDIYRWLIGKDKPTDEALEMIVAKIREQNV